MITTATIAAGSITAAKISGWVNSIILDRVQPTNDEDRVVLKLKGYEPCSVDDYWILYENK